jgi:hypothetical protein
MIVFTVNFMKALLYRDGGVPVGGYLTVWGLIPCPEVFRPGSFRQLEPASFQNSDCVDGNDQACWVNIL